MESKGIPWLHSYLKFSIIIAIKLNWDIKATDLSIWNLIIVYDQICGHKEQAESLGAEIIITE